MDEAIKGAILGGVIGAILVLFEYLVLSKDAKERAVKLHRKPELDEVARTRIKTIARERALGSKGAAVKPAGEAVAKTKKAKPARKGAR